MIDLGLSKLAIIGVVALIVIGPEKLPRVARMAGTLLGRAQRYVNTVKAEVSREIELDELRKAKDNIQNTVSAFQSDMEQGITTAADNLTHHDESGEQYYLTETVIRRKNWRLKQTARPLWYKRATGHRSHVLSGAARMVKHRPPSVAASRVGSSFF